MIVRLITVTSLITIYLTEQKNNEVLSRYWTGRMKYGEIMMNW